MVWMVLPVHPEAGDGVAAGSGAAGGAGCAGRGPEDIQEPPLGSGDLYPPGQKAD